MRLAISNIAWRADEEEDVRALLAARGVDAVEIAPGRIREGRDPAELTRDDCIAYRDLWRASGVEVVAMQALLFGHAELKLFGTEVERRAFVEYLARVVRVGGWIGARALVFGSPKNRLKGALTNAEALAVARDVFGELGRVAADSGTCLCIEPNPPEYGADWIHSARAAKELVDAVAADPRARSGFGLHLDAAALHLAGETADVVRAAAPTLRHFHASQVALAPLAPPASDTAVPHAAYAEALRASGYANVVSIEMRPVESTRSNRAVIERALGFAGGVYG